MIERVNPAHPDKCADRNAGAIVDMTYCIEEKPRIAVDGVPYAEIVGEAREYIC